MIRQYIKQAIRMIGDNKLLSVISILGTALAICMIMVIVILYVVNTASFKPEVNRDRTCYISIVMSKGKEDNRRLSYTSLGLPLVKECCYPLKDAEAVTAIDMDSYTTLTASSMDGLNNRSCYVAYTDTAFWRIFQFDFLAGSPFSPASFASGIRDAVISESVARAVFGTDQVVGREMKLDYVIYNVCGVVKDVSRFASKAWAEVWVPYTVGNDGSYTEGINGAYRCCILLKPGVSREDLRSEVSKNIEAFNSRTSDVKADILHQPTTQMEEWIGGGSEFGTNLFYLYVRYGIILFILLLVPALNLSGITLSRMRRRMGELGVRRAFGATQGKILWQVLSENLVLTLLGGVLGLAMSYGAMLLLKDWLLVTALGQTSLSAGMFNGFVFVAAFLFCLLLNLLSAGLPAWRMSRLNITDSLNA